MIKGITYILETDATFQTRVGYNVALTKYKVYPVIAPQTENIPYSVVRMTDKTLLHKGRSGDNRNSFEVTFTVHSYHKNYDDVDILDQAVIQALVPFRGTSNGVSFGYIEFVSSSDDYVEAYGGLYVRLTSFKAQVILADLT
jgi:hypothetical protein